MHQNSRRPRLRAFLVRTALIAGSVLFALLLLEVGVRVSGVDPEKQPVRPSAPGMPSSQPWLRSHGPAPGGRAVVEVRTNSLGLRDWEHPAKESKRVLALGDSFTFGYGVEIDETYLSVAEQALWDAAPQVDVGFYKVGFNGTSQHVQLEVLMQRWSAISPDIVVLGFSEDTDIDENVVQDPRLRRVLADRDLMKAPPLVLTDDFLYRRSALVRYLKARRLRDEVSGELRAFEEVIEARGGWNIDFDALVRTSWQRRFMGAFSDKLEVEWRISEALLERLRTFIEARGKKLVLFRVPSRTALVPEAWAEAVRSACGHTPANVLSTCGHVDPDYTAKRLRDYASRHGVAYVDPGPALKAFIATGEAIYFPPPEIHWTRLGHERAGRVLAAALAERWKLPRPAVVVAEKKRRFGAFWFPPPKDAPRPSAWIGELQGNAARELSQVLLWAEQARIDFLVFRVTTDGKTIDLDSETRALIDGLMLQRREHSSELRFALAVTTADGRGQTGPAFSRSMLDVLLQQHIEPTGPAYARACGRPLLFVDRHDALEDERFVVIGGSPAAGASATEQSCEERAPPLFGASCADARSLQWLCMKSVIDGRGIDGDPDVLLAPSFNGRGPDTIEPTPADGRLRVALVSDAVGRWKSGSGGRRPSPSALTFFRSWLPFRSAPAVLGRNLEVTDPSVFCMGCWPVEDSQQGSLLWTSEKAVLGVRGLTPGKNYTVTMDILDAGVSSRATLQRGDGPSEQLELHAGAMRLPNPLTAGDDGTLRWALRVDPSQARQRIRGSSDTRWLGISFRAISITE